MTCRSQHKSNHNYIFKRRIDASVHLIVIVEFQVFSCIIWKRNDVIVIKMIH